MNIGNTTVRFGHVGDTDSQMDGAIRTEVVGWLFHNDRSLTDLDFERDVVELRQGRDFLTETLQYDVVVLHYIFNPPAGFQGALSGEFSISPLHRRGNWVKRLLSTQADYIFVIGEETEVSANFLYTLDGYEKVVASRFTVFKRTK